MLPKSKVSERSMYRTLRFMTTSRDSPVYSSAIKNDIPRSELRGPKRPSIIEIVRTLTCHSFDSFDFFYYP